MDFDIISIVSFLVKKFNLRSQHLHELFLAKGLGRGDAHPFNNYSDSKNHGIFFTSTFEEDWRVTSRVRGYLGSCRKCCCFPRQIRGCSKLARCPFGILR